MVISTGFSEFSFVISSEALLPSVIPSIIGLSRAGVSCEILAVDELVLWFSFLEFSELLIEETVLFDDKILFIDETELLVDETVLIDETKLFEEDTSLLFVETELLEDNTELLDE